MAIGTIPPWLNVQPAQFAQAYESGARQGLALSEMRARIAAQQRQHELALQQMQEQAAERQSALEERRKEHEEESGLTREKIASSERIASSREGALDDYRKAQLDLRESQIGIAKSNLDLAREKASLAAESGDARAANALVSLDLKRQQLEMARQRLDDLRNKPEKEPTVSITSPVEFGQPTVRRSGPQSLMEPFIPRPPATNAPAVTEPPPAPGGGGLLGMFRPSRAMAGAMLEPVAGKGMSQLMAPREQAQGVRVRRKSDGKTFTYKGNADDVPLDTYDVLE